jgi:photosystem II stability/assembly factor-like uncharacterized protein
MFALLILINTNLILYESILSTLPVRGINSVTNSSIIRLRGDHSWTCNGPYGGHIHTITADSSFIYAGLSLNGVYRRPLGEVGIWETRRNSIEYFTVLSMLSTPDTIFAGLQRNGLHRTTNGGTTWMKNSFIPDSASVNVIFQYGNDTLFIGTDGLGLYRSTTGGNIWGSIGGAFGDTANARTFTRDSVNLYLGTDKGIFVSNDQGNTWNSLFPGEYINKLGWYYGFLYVGTATSGLFYRDPSNTWRNTSLFDVNITDFSIMGDSLYVATWGDGIFSAGIGNPTFNLKNTGLTNKTITSIEIVDGIIYAGTYGGFFYSPDSANNWYEDNRDLNANMIWDIELNPINLQSVYAVSFGGIYKSNDNGNSWNKYGTTPDTSLFRSIGINPQDSSNIIISSSSGIYQTVDNGINWNSFDNRGHLVSDIEIDPIDPNRAYATAGDVFFISSNNGETWDVADSGKHYNDVEICYSVPETLYIATNEGMFKSNNYGVSLDLINNGLPSDTITRVGIDGNNPSIIYAGLESSLSSYLYRSLDGGQSWESANLTNGPVTEIKTSRGFESHAFVSSMPDEISLTLDGALTWTDIEPLNEGNPLCLDFSPSSHTVYIGNLSGVHAFTDTSISLFDISAPGSFSPDGDSIDDDIRFDITAVDSNQIYSPPHGAIYHDTSLIRNFGELLPEDSRIWDGFNESGILERNGTYRTEIFLTDGFLNFDTVKSYFTLEKEPMISGTSGATSHSEGRNVAVDDSGRIHVVYTTFNPEEVFYVNSDDGTNWSEPLDLSNSKNEKSLNPCIAACHDNTIFVFWEKEYADSHEIVYQRLESGNWLLRPVVLNRSFGELKNPNIAVSPDNNIHLVWEEVDNNDIFYRRYNNSSETWNSPVNISATTGVSRDPFILSHNGLYVFFSDNTDHPENFEVTCRYYNGSNWLEEPLNSSTPGNSISPFAIKDAFDQIHLFWSDSTPGNYDIYYKSFKPDSGWGNDTNLTQTPEHSTSPSISTDELQNVYLFWEEEGEIYRKVREYQYGWQISENISNTPTVHSDHPSSSFNCDLVWTEGNHSPYRITYFKEKISDDTPPEFTITAPDTCFIGDSLFIGLSVDDILDGLPLLWIRDNAGDSIQFFVSEDSNSHYTGRTFIYGLVEGSGTLRISGTDLYNNTTDTTIAIWIISKEFTITAPDTCFIGDSLLVELSVNHSLNDIPDMWIRDNADDSIQLLVSEDSDSNYTGRAFISGLEEGSGDLRMSFTDLYNNTIDTTLNIWIASQGSLMPEDSCFAFPNPTRREYIKFMFYINKTANVTIEIFTLSGRKIKTFVDAEYEGGRIYEESMSVLDMGSDIFIFRATAIAGGEEEVVIKKFGVLR